MVSRRAFQEKARSTRLRRWGSETENWESGVRRSGATGAEGQRYEERTPPGVRLEKRGLVA